MQMEGRVLNETDRSEYVFRGIHAGHPAFAAASTGVVVPGEISADVTAEQHNLRDVSASSCYTSWTHDREIAIAFGRSRGPGGLLLRLPIGSPKSGDSWHWESSPDMWMEEEVLLFGVRIGAEVLRL
jgi:hypothetical protein